MGEPMTTMSTSSAATNETSVFSPPASERRHAGALLENAVFKLSRMGLLQPLAGASSVAAVSLYAVGHFTPWAALSAFFCIYSTYLIDHLSEVDVFDEKMASARSRRLASRRLAGVAYYLLALGIAGWQSGVSAALMLLAFAVAVVFYCMPLLPRRSAGVWRMVRIKDITGLKSIYTAFFWAWLMSFVLVFHQAGTLGAHLSFGGFMFLCLFVNTVLCDFKDMERDRLDGVPMLPLMLGVRRTFQLLRHVCCKVPGG